MVIPVDFELQYASRQPLNNPNCPLAFTTDLSAQTVQAGNTVRLSANLRNTTGQALASPMIVLGLPAGLSLQPWQLKQIMAEKRCDFYEIWDGNIVFHFEQIDAFETRELYLDLKADITGTFEPPANQAFLYYQNEYRVWSKPERVQVE